MILLALEEILTILRSRPYVIMEYIDNTPPPVIIEGEAREAENEPTEKPKQPRKNGRFAKAVDDTKAE